VCLLQDNCPVLGAAEELAERLVSAARSSGRTPPR
jgi:hypothetical protein